VAGVPGLQKGSPGSKKGFKMSRDDIANTLSFFFKYSPVLEIRIPKAKLNGKYETTIAGYFNNLDKAVQSVIKYDTKVPGIYVTLNPVNPALLSRCSNRLDENSKLTTSDKDILKRTFLLVDIDPIRPAGISSTDAEHNAAIAKAYHIREIMAKHGWADPVVCDSGNGASLIYHIDLPNNEESTQTVKKCLEAFDLVFGDKEVGIDLTVFNASRIVKLYGTVAKKGDSTAERPHRESKILEVPAEINPISVDQIGELIAVIPVEEEHKPDKGYSNGFDIQAWMKQYDITVASTKPWNSGTMYVLDKCPFDASHRYPDASIIQTQSGALVFHCFHNSCAKHDWRALRDKLEPNREKRGSEPREKQKASGSKGNGDSQASALIHYVESSDVELFHDDVLKLYARIKINGVNKILSLKSQTFGSWLSGRYYRETGTAPGSDAINSALSVIKAIAEHDGKQYNLSVRCCWHDGAIWYDLADWTAVKITAQGWGIMKDVPILFMTLSHMKSSSPTQNAPIAEVKKILEFIPIKDEGEKLLFLVALVSYFIPDIAHVCLVFYGEKGAAKSTVNALIKRLVDPSALSLLSPAPR